MAQSSKREICATNTSLLPYLNPIFLQIFIRHTVYRTKITHLADQLFLQTKSPNTNNFLKVYTIIKQIIPSPNYKTAGAVFKYPLSFSLAKILVLTICTHILIFIIKNREQTVFHHQILEISSTIKNKNFLLNGRTQSTFHPYTGFL